MPNRIAVTTAVTLALAIGSGTVALATTLTGSPGPVGTAAAVSLDRPVSTPNAAPAAPEPAFDPEAVALLAFAAKVNETGVAAAAKGAAPGAATMSGTTFSPGGSTAATPSSPTTPKPTRGTPPPTPAPTAAPTTSTTTPPPFDCRGSDDGLSEAVKHAREAYCHGEDDD